MKGEGSDTSGISDRWRSAIACSLHTRRPRPRLSAGRASHRPARHPTPTPDLAHHLLRAWPRAAKEGLLAPMDHIITLHKTDIYTHIGVVSGAMWAYVGIYAILGAFGNTQSTILKQNQQQQIDQLRYVQPILLSIACLLSIYIPGNRWLFLEHIHVHIQTKDT